MSMINKIVLMIIFAKNVLLEMNKLSLILENHKRQ